MNKEKKGCSKRGKKLLFLFALLIFSGHFIFSIRNRRNNSKSMNSFTEFGNF